jgi:hypothetical protein
MVTLIIPLPAAAIWLFPARRWLAMCWLSEREGLEVLAARVAVVAAVVFSIRQTRQLLAVLTP